MRLLWGRNSLRARMSALTLAATGGALLLAGFGLVYFDQRAERGQRLADVREQADEFLQAQRGALELGEAEATQAALRDFAQRHEFPFASLRDSQRGELARVGVAGPSHLRFDQVRDFLLRGEQLALRRQLELSSGRQVQLLLVDDLSELRLRSVRLVIFLVAAISLALLLTQLFVRRLILSIAAPIESFADVAEEISRSRDYTRRVQNDGDGEIAAFAGLFNEMLSQIEAHDETLREANDSLEGRVVERTQELRAEIERRTKMEAELIRAKDEATAAAAAKSEFLANMSHEIRTPLIGVIGMAELLQDTHLDELQRQFTETLVGSAQHLLTLINDLLDYSRLAAGGMQVEATEFDLCEICYETAQLLVPSACDKGVEIAVDYPLSTPRRVIGDPARVRQVLINLVGNAVKFTKEGSIAIEALLDSATAQEQWFRLRVRDTGIGIAAEKLESIFEQFTQADASTTRQYGGTGLGLAITRSLMELMGGQVSVESQVGAGTTFELRLPFRPVELQKPLPMPERDWAEVQTLVIMPAGEPRSIAVRMLRRLGLEVQAHDSGEGAGIAHRLQRGEHERFPRLVLADAGAEPDRTLASLRALAADLGDKSPCFALLADLVQLGSDEQLRDLVGGFVVRKPLRHENLVRLLDLVVHEAVQDGPERQRKALLAEDNAVNQRMVGKMLERCGFQVTLAADGREAVTAARRESFDLLLLDCHMPEMDGLRATRLIRELSEEKSRALIVGMLSQDRSMVTDTCLRAGMNEVLSKPITFAKLEALTQRHFPLAIV